MVKIIEVYICLNTENTWKPVNVKPSTGPDLPCETVIEISRCGLFCLFGQVTQRKFAKDLLASEV